MDETRDVLISIKIELQCAAKEQQSWKKLKPWTSA